MKVVCFDTHILIWGVEGTAAAEPELATRTRAYLQHLVETRSKVLVPSLVVAELLMRHAPADHPKIMHYLEEHFMVVPFDLLAASQFARIWQVKTAAESHRQARAAGVPRNRMKVDSMIVATALAHGADYICSHDEDIARFAEGFLPVNKVPHIVNKAPEPKIQLPLIE